MVALREFTVADLISASGDEPKTIRSNLGRIEDKHPHVLERVHSERNGKRGGVWIRYRVTSTGVRWLEREILELEPRVLPPEDLLAAQEILLTELPGQSDPGLRAWMRERAGRLLDSGRTVGRHHDVP